MKLRRTASFPQLVATTTTGTDGSYDLRSAATPAIVAAERGNGGYANFELDTADPASGLTSAWFFSTGVPAVSQARQATQPADLGRGWRDPVTHQVTRKTIRIARGAAGVAQPAPRTLHRMATVVTPNMSAPCSWAQVRSYEKPVAVGEVHSWTGQGDMFTYGSNADTQVQTGITGSDGLWHVGGSVHVGNSSSSGSAGVTGITGRHPNGTAYSPTSNFATM